MLVLSERIAAAFPGVLRGAGVSVVRIRTTQPVVLFFNPGETIPACAAQRGDSEGFATTHGILARISSRDPGLVAEPLGCVNDDSGMTWGVVRGLPGWPWFALPARYPGTPGLEAVTRIGLATVRRFRDAVSAYDLWRSAVSPRARLEDELRAIKASHPALFASIQESTRHRWLSALDGLDGISWHKQHGDFCLNNLLIDDGTAAIVDFEEFGLTTMPLHDEFSLAFSLYEFSERLNLHRGLQGLLRLCIEELPLGGTLKNEALEALLAHHLFWRLNQCSSRPTRAQMAERLADYVRAVLSGKASEG